MKLLIAANVSAICVAATTEALEGWSKLGAIGILGALLMVLILRTLPQIAKDNKEAAETLAKSIEGMGTELKAQRAELKEHYSDQLELMKEWVNEHR